MGGVGGCVCVCVTVVNTDVSGILGMDGHLMFLPAYCMLLPQPNLGLLWSGVGVGSATA